MIDYLNSINKLEFPKVKNHIQRYAVSEAAKEKINNLLPICSFDEIRNRLDAVTETKSLLESDEPLPLDNLPEIRDALNRAGILDYAIPASEIFSIGIFLKTSRIISSYFSKRKAKYLLLNQLTEPLYIDKILEYNIDRTIDESGQVKDSASAGLRKIRKELNDRSENLRKVLDSILKNASSLGWTQEELITARDGRMVIPVKVENKNRVPGFVHSMSASGATVFIEPAETLEMNNDIRSLQFQELREIEKILKELTAQIRNVKDNLKQNVEILSELDFLQATAKYSIEIIGCAPQLNEKNYFSLIDGRHPVLLLKQPREKVVPLTLQLGKNFSTLIITGPNAGGKSVAIKTFGLLAIMVQSGLHIPASPDSEFGVYNKIFVDIGDEQSIENDLSTFSSHLVNINTIMKEAEQTSLVLIDEIGAGTDPSEGSALAEAILEDLTKRKTHTLVTTHHGTLKAFAHETEGIENGAMEFDHHTLKPTYRFISGIPGSSYALEMAKRIGLPDPLIQRSIYFRGEATHSLENLLAEIETKQQILEDEIRHIQEERLSLANLISEYTTKNKSLQKEIKHIKSKAVDEAKAIIADANRQIERTIQQIREEGASKKIIKQTQSAIEQIKTTHSSLAKEFEINENNTLDELFSIGDKVMLKNSTEVGEIIEAVGENHFNVLFGQFKIKAVKTNLIKVKSTGPMLQRSKNLDINTERPASEIDLRGSTGEEAIALLDKFIDTAILYGLHRLDIIHGKGTGSLQKKVTEYLKKNVAVKSFRLGEWNEGGYGVTVVELK